MDSCDKTRSIEKTCIFDKITQFIICPRYCNGEPFNLAKKSMQVVDTWQSANVKTFNSNSKLQ